MLADKDIDGAPAPLKAAALISGMLPPGRGRGPPGKPGGDHRGPGTGRFRQCHASPAAACGPPGEGGESDRILAFGSFYTVAGAGSKRSPSAVDPWKKPTPKRTSRNAPAAGLVGAIALSPWPVILPPMAMDHEPRQPSQDVEIRIPGQDDGTALCPKWARMPRPVPEAAIVDSKTGRNGWRRPTPGPRPPSRKTGRSDQTGRQAGDKPAAAAPTKPSPSPVKTHGHPGQGTPTAKPSGPLPSWPARAEADRQGRRAWSSRSAPSPTRPANVKRLKSKLSELGIKVYTEPLETRGARSTRVRPVPFPNREAADKALEKMKRIGVSGVVKSAK